jgi:hypothetical protein
MDRDAPIDRTGQIEKADLEAGYREMAADREREMEAEEWTEKILFVPE